MCLSPSLASDRSLHAIMGDLDRKAADRGVRPHVTAQQCLQVLMHDRAGGDEVGVAEHIREQTHHSRHAGLGTIAISVSNPGTEATVDHDRWAWAAPSRTVYTLLAAGPGASCERRPNRPETDRTAASQLNVAKGQQLSFIGVRARQNEGPFRICCGTPFTRSHAQAGSRCRPPS